jgi:plastocyanin
MMMATLMPKFTGLNGPAAGTDDAALRAALAEADVVVELSGFTFSPTVVTITPGKTVTWVRRDGFHNVADDDGSYRSGAVSDSWQTFSHTFADVGESLYHCEAHGGVGGVGMAGRVVVQVSGQSERKLYLPALARQPE